MESLLTVLQIVSALGCFLFSGLMFVAAFQDAMAQKPQRFAITASIATVLLLAGTGVAVL